MTTHLAMARQQGAALLLGVLLLGVLGVALVAYFGLSLLAGHTMRQQYANDAVAYSAAVAQSRALNLLSFTQRAQLAHQVALAHLITLASWHQAGLMQQARLRQANPPLHLLALFFGPGAAASYQSSQGLHTSDQRALQQAIAEHEYAVQHSLRALQRDVLMNLPAEREHIAHTVVQANFPELPAQSWQLRIHQDDWSAAWRPEVSMPWHILSGLQHIQGMYAFLHERNHDKRSLWVVDKRCPWRRHELRRRGSTVLGNDGRWRASDTQSLHAIRANRWVGCYSREYPMAWAWMAVDRAHGFGHASTDQPPDNFSEQSFWRWVQEHTSWDIFTGNANALANSWALRDQQPVHTAPMPPLLELQQQQALAFRVDLRIQGPAFQWVATQSGAESFFRHPESSNSSVESPNLFQPYWLARLSQNAVQELP